MANAAEPKFLKLFDFQEYAQPRIDTAIRLVEEVVSSREACRRALGRMRSKWKTEFAARLASDWSQDPNAVSTALSEQFEKVIDKEGAYGAQFESELRAQAKALALRQQRKAATNIPVRSRDLVDRIMERRRLQADARLVVLAVFTHGSRARLCASPICGELIFPKRMDQKFCDAACKTDYHNHKRRTTNPPKVNK